MKLDVRPEVVEDLVHKLAGGGVNEAAVQVELLLTRRQSGVTDAECRWALQRFRGMTPAERRTESGPVACANTTTRP